MQLIATIYVNFEEKEMNVEIRAYWSVLLVRYKKESDKLQNMQETRKVDHK